MRCYRTTGREGPVVVLEDAEDPRPGHGELGIDLRAASINYRDLTSHRIEAVKRQMSGRAKVDLLRARLRSCDPSRPHGLRARAALESDLTLRIFGQAEVRAGLRESCNSVS